MPPPRPLLTSSTGAPLRLYSATGPNPRVVELFAAAKGVSLERVAVDLAAGENRQPAHLARNSLGQVPVLEVVGGPAISQVTAICDYLEELVPAPPLIGATPEERAETRMWVRRIDLMIAEPMTAGFRSSDGRFYFEGKVRLMPHAADDLKRIARDGLDWLEGEMAGRRWICGDRFTLADILLFCFIDFGRRFDQGIPAAHDRLAAWFEGARTALGID